MDCNEVVALVIMDLSKAFDCLPHDLMAAKLIAYGMSHSTVKNLISYLRHHKQCVKIGSWGEDLYATSRLPGYIIALPYDFMCTHVEVGANWNTPNFSHFIIKWHIRKS